MYTQSCEWNVRKIDKKLEGTTQTFTQYTLKIEGIKCKKVKRRTTKSKSI